MRFSFDYGGLFPITATAAKNHDKKVENAFFLFFFFFNENRLKIKKTKKIQSE